MSTVASDSSETFEKSDVLLELIEVWQMNCELELTKKESLTNEVETLLEAKNSLTFQLKNKKVWRPTRKMKVSLESEATVPFRSLYVPNFKTKGI